LKANSTTFRQHAAGPVWLMALVWVSSINGLAYPIWVQNLALIPRTAHGLVGIATMPFVHGSIAHLAINSASLIVLAAFVALDGRRSFIRVTIAICLLGGLLLWLVGRPAMHIGASGLIFGYFGYLLVFGVYDRRLRSMAIAAITAVAYGGLLFGLLPGDARVSWEAHLTGFFAGAVVARLIAARRRA